MEQTYREIPRDIVDEVILTDDHSQDDTVAEARRLGIKEIQVHDRNKGYGGNQKTCYNRALELGADIVIMLHPDYQYTPKLIHSMAYVIADGVYPVVLGSRILGKGARKGGMPLIKYVANRLLTLTQNLLLKQKALGVPHRLPGFLGRGAACHQLQRQFGRLCVRQRNAGADILRRIRDRRNYLPHPVFR